MSFRVDRDKNLFSKEDNETVIGEYLNMKFADDLRGKSLRVIMVLTCMGLSRIEVAWSRRCLFFDGHVTVVHKLNGGKKIIVPPFAYLQEEELWKESDNIPFPKILGYYQDALLKAGKEILRVANYDVLYMIKAYDEVKERDPLRGTCLLEAAQQLNEWLMHNNEASSDMIVYKMNQLQISRRQRQFSDYERTFLIDVIKSDQFNASLKAGTCLIVEASKEKFYYWFDKC